MRSGAVTAALALAGRYPSAFLPCPGCGASVKGENLSRHLDKTHPGLGDSDALPSRLRIEPDAVVVRRRLGFGNRRVTLPATVEIGGLTKSVPSAGMTSYADDYNVPHDDVAAGTYLRLTGNGTTLVVACPQSTAVRKHWTGWTAGPRRGRAHLRLDAPAFVAVQYALADCGILTLHSGRAT